MDRNRPRLLVWWGIGNLMVVSLILYVLVNNHALAVRYAERNAINLAHLIEQRIEDEFETIDLALKRIVDDYPLHQPRGQHAVNAWLQMEQTRHPNLNILRMADASGDFLNGQGAPAGQQQSIADREYFTHLRDHPEAGLQITPPLIGRATGKTVVVLARRLQGTRGEFAGVVFASLRAEHFGNVVEHLNLGTDDLLELRGQKNALIVSRPQRSDATDARDPLGAPQATLKPSGLDHGILVPPPELSGYAGKIFSYHVNHAFGFTVRVGLSRAEALAAWTREATTAGILGTAFALLSLLFILQLHRATRRQEEAIDTLQRQETRISDSKQLLTAFLDNLPGLAYIKDETLRVRAANGSFRTMLGMDPEAMLGKHTAELFPEEFANKIMADDRRILESGKTERIEEAFAGHWYETIKFAIPQGDNRLLGGITVDTTERHQTEQRTRLMLELHDLAMRAPEATLLLRGITGMAVLTQSRHAFLQVSPANPGEPPITMWFSADAETPAPPATLQPILMPEGTLAAPLRVVAPLLLNDAPVLKGDTGAPIRHPDLRRLAVVPVAESQGLQLIVGLVNKPAPYNDLDIQSLQIVANALWSAVQRQRAEVGLRESVVALKALNTRLEQAQNQLLQSEKMASIGQLAAGVAHELNNPIGFVQSNLGTLATYVEDMLELIEHCERCAGQCPDVGRKSAFHALHESKDVDFVRQDVRQLLLESRDGADRVRRIVQNLKDFSHVSEDEWIWADLRKGLESTLTIVWNELKYKAEVIKALEPIPDVFCVPAQLNQVFMNLLVNAAQAIETKGRITIATGTQDDHVWIEIRDNGKGIAPENHHRIFEPFYTTKPVGKGTGLGLSLAYSIVQKHSGQLTFTSAVGEGTTFRITLPRSGPPDRGATAASPQSETSQK